MGKAENKFGQILKKSIGNLALLSPFFAVVLYMVVSTYADPYIDKKINEKMKPMETKTIKIQKKIKQIKFTNDKILLILEKSTDPKIIKEVNKDIERFRPDTSKAEM